MATEPLQGRNLAKLQAMIDRTAKAASAFNRHQSELNEWARNHYGAEPGDIDADYIIDSIFGGCGMASGMPADQFDQIMREGTSNGNSGS